MKVVMMKVKMMLTMTMKAILLGAWGAVIHADGAAEGLSLGDDGGLGGSLGAGVWFSAVVIPHGFDVASAAHSATGDLSATVRAPARITPTPVVWGDLPKTQTAQRSGFKIGKPRQTAQYFGTHV